MTPFGVTTERLVLDGLGEDDVDEITRHCQDPLFEEVLSTPWPYRRSDAEFFVRELVPNGWSGGNEFTWAIRLEHDAPLLGVIGFRFPSSSIGFWLGAEHRGLGYMPEALRAVVDALFAMDAGVREVLWECVVGNAASASVARKCGFRHLGTYDALVPDRDGRRPASWRGVLDIADDRTEKPGWPA